VCLYRATLVPRSPANRATNPRRIGADSRTIKSRHPDASDHDNTVI
jgi:hypothetical protein